MKIINWILLLVILMSSCSPEPISLNSLSRNIVGTWVDMKGNNYYYFLSDGNGYTEATNSYDGIARRAYVWETKDSIMIMNYIGDNYYSESEKKYYVYVDDGEVLSLTDLETNKTNRYNRINDVASTNIDYKKSPFINYVRIYGYYYEISKAEMSCEHGIGTNANFKHLMIYGANETLTPTGVRFMYSTPYYEGINKEWLDGSYKIQSKSGYWIYGGVYIERGAQSSRCDGELNIKTAGKYKIIEFKLDDGDVIGHIEGNWF